MPAAQPSLDLAAAAAVIDEHLHAPVPTDQLGLELEWLVSDPADRARRPGMAELEALRGACGAFPEGGEVTIEPGGQLELVTRPHDAADALCAAATADLVHLMCALAPTGLDLVALGCDPLRPPARVTEAPRYRAMEAHFDHRNDAGRTMMCNTAAIQLNIGRGSPSDEERRWRTVNLLGPVLIASFANSPFDLQGPSGWCSTRLRAWWAIDPSRAAPVPLRGSLGAAWERYVLDASVMLIRRGADDFAPLPPGFSFGQWLHEGHELGWPSADDLAYHLTTLFPPVRPRGWFELRMLDALPSPFWLVAAVIVDALLAPEVHDDVAAAVAGTEDLWYEAARAGLSHPALAAAAARCFAVARQQLAARRADAGVQAVVASFDERWVRAGRCPADDALARFEATGDVLPDLMPTIPFARLAESVA